MTAPCHFRKLSFFKTLKFHVFSSKEWTPGWKPQTASRSQKALTHCWFWSRHWIYCKYQKIFPALSFKRVSSLKTQLLVSCLADRFGFMWWGFEKDFWTAFIGTAFHQRKSPYEKCWYSVWNNVSQKRCCRWSEVTLQRSEHAKQDSVHLCCTEAKAEIDEPFNVLLWCALFFSALIFRSTSSLTPSMFQQLRSFYSRKC